MNNQYMTRDEFVADLVGLVESFMIPADDGETLELILSGIAWGHEKYEPGHDEVQGIVNDVLNGIEYAEE